MPITDYQVSQAHSDLKDSCGGVKNDYFGLLYLEQAFHVPRTEAVSQVAFGGNDYGIDGFHFDPERRNFYLLQFKYSESYAQFKSSFLRLTQAGMQQVFSAQSQDALSNQLLMNIKSNLHENQAMVDRLYVLFVFAGDVQEANRSQVMDKLREDLEGKKHLIDKFFGREVNLIIEFRSAKSLERGAVTRVQRTHTYQIHLEDVLERTGPNGERMQVGFLHLADLLAIYGDMKSRFFERNIRSALPDDVAVNRALARAYRSIILDGRTSPGAFAFNHNGVTLSAESLVQEEGVYRITEPRLLNGAQTLTTLERFVGANRGILGVREAKDRLDRLQVLCKVITAAGPDFITSVTVNNNRQNPIEPWNLRANDLVQLALQDKFKDEANLFYERQENAFINLSDEDLEDEGVAPVRPIKIKELAQTFLAVDGQIDRMSRLKEVFEDDRSYGDTFCDARVKADVERVLICYKVQYRIRMLVRAIAEKGASKYEYINRARNLLWALLCQGMLNDPNLGNQLERYGKSLSVEAEYTEWLNYLATNRCRFIISDLVSEEPFASKASQGNWAFLRTNQAYKRCMEHAFKRYKWVHMKLR